MVPLPVFQGPSLCQGHSCLGAAVWNEDLASPAVSELETLLLLAHSAHPDSGPSCCSCSHFIDDGLRLRGIRFFFFF